VTSACSTRRRANDASVMNQPERTWSLAGARFESLTRSGIVRVVGELTGEGSYRRAGYES
jgi:hypothetical protein